MPVYRTLLVLCFAAVAAAPAQAQPAAAPPKNDAALSVGWLGAKYPSLETYNRWHQTVQSGAQFGHYWTDNLKSEVEAAWLSRVRARSYETQQVPEGTINFESSYRFQGAKLSLSQIYQFGENAWVHPYLGAGVDVDYLRADEERPAQVAYAYVPGASAPPRSVSLPTLSARETSVHARPFVKGGFKIYTSDRVFISTEWKFGFGGDGLQHVLWKTGLGFDF